MNWRSILKRLTADRLLAAGLSCGVLAALGVVAGFNLIWRQWPSGSGDPGRTLFETRTPPAAATLAFPSPVPATPASLPSLTPDPNLPALPGKLVFVCFIDSFDEICWMDPNGQEIRRLTNNAATDFYPEFSPDGQWIIFSSRRDGQFELYRMDLNGGQLVRLTTGLGSLFAPTVSPDGSQIAFTNARGGVQSIWVMDWDGGNPQPLTDDTADDLDPSWSPNGQFISFASSRAGGVQLFLIDVSTRAISQVTRDIPDIGGRNDWSPDGTRLAFYAGPAADRNIFTINLKGEDLQQLSSGGDNLAPSYSIDGAWIVFTSFRDGNNELYRMRTDGSEITRLTFNTRSDWQPRWGP